MLALLVIVLLFHHPRYVTSNVLLQEIETYHTETYYKAQHAQRVVNKIYHAFRQWFFTITFCEFTYFENRILKYTESMDYGYPVLLLSGCPNSSRTREKPKINIHGQTVYVITSDELNLDGSEYVIEALSSTGVFKPRTPVIFILNMPVTIDGYFFYTMKNHFQLLWSRSITNSVVMLLWSDKLWTYSYNHFLNEIEDVTYVKDVFHWLTQQYDDLYGHELRLSVFKKLFQNDDKQQVRCDSRLTTTVMNQLNATCKPIPPRDGVTVGDLLPNGTASGVTADLIDGYTDLELNSRVLKNSYYGYIDTTYPLVQDELCFLVKNYAKQSTFTTIIQLISIKTLIFLMFNVVFLIVIAIVAREMEMRMWSLKRTRSINTTVVLLVKCFIRQTAEEDLPALVYRCIVLLIMLYSLIVDCAIDGIITTAITYPRYWNYMNTMDELIKSNLTIAVHQRHFGMFNQSLDDGTYDFLKTNNRIELMNGKRIVEIITKQQFNHAVLLRKTDLFYVTRNVSNTENGRPLYRILPDCPIPCSIVYGLRYGSPYLNKINNILHRLNQGGILQHWAKTEEIKNLKNLYDPEIKSLRPLTLVNLQELFVVWAIGLGISTIAFFIELVIYYRKHHKIFVWKLCEYSHKKI